jgi:hypothetical protein
MNTLPKPPMEGTWIIPYDWMMLADGTFVLRPKKPVQVMNARETARFTGLSKKTLARLAESGFISVEWPTPRMPRYYPGEVLEFIRQTRENPNHWTPERLRQYGLGRRG